jgi:hypothetical protein
MLKGILLSASISTALLVSTVALTNEIRYDMPFKASYANLTPETKQEIECLAENIYFESAMEPREGKMAVAFVTLNRVKSGKFEDSICGVVKQKIRNVCQFSWWCEAKPYFMSTNKVLTNSYNPLYNDIREIAIHVYLNHERMEDPSKGAMFYHADYVFPQWKNMTKTAVIGRHIFYNKKDLKAGELI